MEDLGSAVARLRDGEAVELADLRAEMDELELKFDDLGFSYIAVNGWLISSLEGDAKARDLMFLRSLFDRIGHEAEGRVTFTLRREDEGETLCEIDFRYAPSTGYLNSVPSAERIPS